MIFRKASNLICYGMLLFYCLPLYAHHVLGRPSYSLNEDSTTPPSMQVETQIGSFYVTYMVFPAFPSPKEPGRVNLYVTRIDNGKPYTGQIIFKVRDDSWFSSREEILGIQNVDDNVFRQGFEFSDSGKYIIRAEFESGGEPYQIDFPLQIGDPPALGPIGFTVSLIMIVIVGVNLLQRKRLTSAKISKAHSS